MVVPLWLLTGQRASTQCGKRSLFPFVAKGPFRTEKRTKMVVSRHEDSRRTGLITDADRSLEKRNPWAGFKTEMEYEAERNKRVTLVFIGVIGFTVWTTKFYNDRALVPLHSENFEMIRKQNGVEGSFPPDFETEEEKAQWKH